MKTNKTQAIMAYLRENGPATSRDIALDLDLPNASAVTALLKNIVNRGEVIRVDDCLQINPDWNDGIPQARRLLERAGFQVIPPTRNADRITDSSQAAELARIAERKEELRRRFERV